MLAQAVQEDRSDMRPLVRLPGFFLDDRGERHKLIGRIQEKIGRAMRPDLCDEAMIVLLHSANEIGARHAAWNLVSLGQKAALGRSFANIAHQDIIATQTRDDLIAGQTLRNCYRMENLTAGDERVHHFAHAGVLMDQIFASLHSRAIAFDKQRDIEDQRTVDDPFVLELADDIGDLGARRDVEYFVGLQRPRLLEPVCAPDDAKEAGKSDEQEKRQETRQRGKSRPTLVRSRRRRRHIRLQGLVWALQLRAAAKETRRLLAIIGALPRRNAFILWWRACHELVHPADRTSLTRNPRTAPNRHRRSQGHENVTNKSSYLRRKYGLALARFPPG